MKSKIFANINAPAMIKERLNIVPVFFKLIRWPNLLIMIVVQLALYYVIIGNTYHLAGITRALSQIDLMLLIFTTVLIAAAGYIINDYFDIKADEINKPDQMILGKKLDHRAGVVLHLILNGVAFITGFYVALRVGSWRLGLLFPVLMILLWFYSLKYKKTVLWGNIAVAFLSAMVIIVIWLFEFFMLRQKPGDFVNITPYLATITRYFGMFAFFAFLLTLIREIVKDAEDVEGDRQAGYSTLAVVYGIGSAKRFAILTGMIVVAFMVYVVFRFINQEMVTAGAYYAITVVGPMVWLMFKIGNAKEKNDFHLISNLLKVIMAAGIIGLQPIAMSF